MIIMDEKVMGVFGTTGFEKPSQAEITMMQKFNDLGFTVVDPAMVRRNLIQSKGLRMLEGDDRAAAAVGLQHGTELTIIGTAISKQAGAKLLGTQMQSVQATLTARVIRNDDARVIASASATASQPHIDEVQGGVLAIEKAAQELADNLSSSIMDKWKEQKQGGDQEITLNISGLISYRHLDSIMYYFEEKLPSAKGVSLRSFTSGVADVGLVYQGQMSDLARLIANKRFTGFRLEPTHVTSHRMDLVVVMDRR